MRNRMNERLQELTPTTLIVGVDIAKKVHWARFVDYRGIEIGKAVPFRSNREGFEDIVAKIDEHCKHNMRGRRFGNVVVGMEPTGHYWKTFAHYLKGKGLRVVCINPHHTKKAKEFDDNSQTKSDYKDALTIAKLVTGGHYFDAYLPEGLYAELRVLTNMRVGEMKRANAVKNTITAIMDEYFPEFEGVFKGPLKGKTARHILKTCPFPAQIAALGEDGVLAEFRKAVKKTVGAKKARELVDAANVSVGVSYGQTTARLRLNGLLDELDRHEKRLGEIEGAMADMLKKTSYSEQMLGIKGIGVVSAASFLGEVGDPLRFQSPRQIARYAGYNLVEDSSGNSKSKTRISKRGRKQLRGLLYQMAFTAVGSNAEMKELYGYLTTRSKNPLKKKQALVVISKKIIAVIYSLLKHNETYKPELVFGAVRREMLKAA